MKHQFILFLTLVIVLFASCTTDVNWDEEINRLANGQTVVVPVGDATITLADLLLQFDKPIFDEDLQKNVFVKYNDTLIWNFDKFDGVDDMDELVDNFNPYNLISGLNTPSYNIPVNTPLTTSFPHTIALGFNSDPTKNRVDRAEINSAMVEFELTTTNISIRPEDITVTVIFPSDFLIFDANGESKITYKPTALNTKQYISLSSFKMYPTNSMTSVDLTIRVDINAVNAPIAITPTSNVKLSYKLFDVNSKAYFGYFVPAISLAYRNQTVDLSEYVDLVPPNGIFKLSEPEISMKVFNNSGIRLKFQVDSLKAYSTTNPAYVPVYARFNNSFSRVSDLGRKLNVDDSPAESTILLNHEEANGNIDTFFEKFPLPNTLFYRFFLLNGALQSDPLNFITPKDEVKVHLGIKVPLKLNAGSTFTVRDTIENVDFSTVTNDEFLEKTEILIKVTNAMPLKGKLSLKMLDANKQTIPELTLLTESLISAPTIDAEGLVVSGGEKDSEITFEIDKSKYPKLKTARYVEFEFLVEGDENKKITFRKENYIKFKLGLLLKGGKIVQVNS